MGAIRYLAEPIEVDALRSGKMAFISGPRQVGKTTLAKRMLASPQNYFSWDDTEFRKAWSRSPRAAVSERGPGPIALDEIHKDKRWKTRLKGVFDVAGPMEGIVVTGSARLDLFRRGGDSLLGRYLPYRLHPLSSAESETAPTFENLLRTTNAQLPVSQLLQVGGFPEPFFTGSEAKARRWSRLRLERLVREDVRDLRAIEDLSGLRVLADLLPSRVGSLLSIKSLQEDVGVAYATVRAWVQVFCALYHCFTIRPYAKRVHRAVHVAPKLYLFDILQIPQANTGARLENLTALHLLKMCHYFTDTAQAELELRFVRDKEKREVDFLVLKDGAPWWLVECHQGEIAPSPAIRHFAQRLKPVQCFQLVTRPGYDRQYAEGPLRVLDYERFLAGLV